MNIYFSGIGGVGIGPLAQIALDAGYEVQGSDVAASLITNELRARGVAIELSQDGSFLYSCHEENPIDWFVYTAALPANHPELVLARQLGIRTAKRDELLAHIIKEKSLKLIAIAGTHGKTTTTGMMVWAMQQRGIPVSYSIGTTVSFGPSGKYDPESQYFIYECDEFDRNFLHFTPFLSLITSIDYDHPDTYPIESDYDAAFSQFAAQSSQVITWEACRKPAITLPGNSWVLADHEAASIKLAGVHNRANATLVMKACEYLRIGNQDEVISVLEDFPGTQRRFEKLVDNLYSDYGHHPIEIAATLQMASELSDQVVLVYQPHQNIRQHEIKDEYYDQFERAEKIYWLPTYLSREDPNLPIISPEELTRNITNKSSVEIADLNDGLWQYIQKARHEGKLVLAMGAGSIDKWLRDQLTR